jgi:hypothetical protein
VLLPPIWPITIKHMLGLLDRTLRKMVGKCDTVFFISDILKILLTVNYFSWDEEIDMDRVKSFMDNVDRQRNNGN